MAYKKAYADINRGRKPILEGEFIRADDYKVEATTQEFNVMKECTPLKQ